MSLTDDEKKEILEPYGRGYSHRRIADRTGHSETTIRNVINEACREVVKLKDDGLQVEQIASQLDYSLAFVSRILRKYEEKEVKQEEKIKAEIEAEVEPKMEAEVDTEVETEVNEASKELDVKTEWSQFQRDHVLEQRKEQIRKQAKESISLLNESGTEYKNEGLFNIDYDTRQKTIEKELENFVLVKKDTIDSIEDISALESILKGINKRAAVLYDKYNEEIVKAGETRKKNRKKRSDQLLDKRIDIPLFPDFVKNEIKRIAIVGNDEEASVVAHAMLEYGQYALLPAKKGPEFIKQLWEMFVDNVIRDEWKYLNMLAKKYRERKYPS